MCDLQCDNDPHCQYIASASEWFLMTIVEVNSEVRFPVHRFLKDTDR